MAACKSFSRKSEAVTPASPSGAKRPRAVADLFHRQTVRSQGRADRRPGSQRPPRTAGNIKETLCEGRTRRQVKLETKQPERMPPQALNVVAVSQLDERDRRWHRSCRKVVSVCAALQFCFFFYYYPFCFYAGEDSETRRQIPWFKRPSLIIVRIRARQTQYRGTALRESHGCDVFSCLISQRDALQGDFPVFEREGGRGYVFFCFLSFCQTETRVGKINTLERKYGK